MYKELHFWSKASKCFSIFLVFIFCACDEIIEKDISNEEVTIISPKDSLQIESSNIGFYWEQVDGAHQYQLQLVTTSFQEIRSFTADTVLNNTYYETQLSAGQYEWRVKALNNGYETLFTPIRRLGIIDSSDLSNDILNLISPPEGSYFKNGELTFRWEELPKASQYIFEIVNYPEFKDTSNVSVLTKEIMLEDGEYEWRVKAINDVSLISSVNRIINFDNTAPNTSNIAINNEDSLSIDDFLSWERMSLDVVEDSVFISSSAEMDDNIAGYPQSFTDESQLSISQALFTKNATYYIQIKSIDRAKNESELTEILQFYVE